MGGGLASEALLIFEFSRNFDSINYYEITTVGESPGGRYGHSLVQCKPHLVLFGGYKEKDPLNDLWVLNVSERPY